MFKRTSTACVAGLTVLGTALLVTTLIAATSAGGRTPLDKEVLAQSRGGNPNNVLLQSSCDVLNGNFSCAGAAVGTSCVTCSTTTFTNLWPFASGGGYDVGTGFQSCGNNQSGRCNWLGVCVVNANVGICNTPSDVVIQ